MRALIALTGLLVLTACGGFRDDLTDAPQPLGAFELGHNISVAPAPQKGPFSRDATPEEWTTAMQTAVDQRFSRYDGGRYYHIATAVEGYVLGQVGIPLIYSPRSVLIFSVNFYDDATQSRLNAEQIQLTVFEPCCGIPFLSSGLTKSKEEQMEGLAFNAARAIERTMRQNGELFGGTSEVLEPDDTIVAGNVLVDDPASIAPQQVDPAAAAAPTN